MITVFLLGRLSAGVFEKSSLQLCGVAIGQTQFEGGRSFRESWQATLSAWNHAVVNLQLCESPTHLVTEKKVEPKEKRSLWATVGRDEYVVVSMETIAAQFTASRGL